MERYFRLSYLIAVVVVVIDKVRKSVIPLWIIIWSISAYFHQCHDNHQLYFSLWQWLAVTLNTKPRHSMTRKSHLSYYTHMSCRLLNWFYWFSDKLYGLIISCGPKGTADHIITLLIESQQLSRLCLKIRCHLNTELLQYYWFPLGRAKYFSKK